MRASRGDATAAKTLLDRLCGPVASGPAVAIDNRQVNGVPVSKGPPLPKGKDFGDWVKQLNHVAAAQGLLKPEDTPEGMVDAAVAEVRDAEELLS